MQGVAQIIQMHHHSARLRLIKGKGYELPNALNMFKHA